MNCFAHNLLGSQNMGIIIRRCFSINNIQNCMRFSQADFLSNCEQRGSKIQHYHPSTWSKVTVSCLQGKPESNARQQSTAAVASADPSLWDKVKKGLGIKNSYSKSKLSVAAFNMYTCCAEIPDYDEIFRVLKMPDSLYSYFLLVELHVWLCMVRLLDEGDDGYYVRNALVENMWSNIVQRGKELGKQNHVRIPKSDFNLMNQHFYTSLIYYDEGLLCSDKVLANSLWDILFERRDIDCESLELMVQYVRKQFCFTHLLQALQVGCPFGDKEPVDFGVEMEKIKSQSQWPMKANWFLLNTLKHLDSQESSLLLSTGMVHFLPLHSETLDLERINPILFKMQLAQFKK